MLFVIVDTLRADRVATYGYTKGATPVLTRLAKQGVQFDWAMAASSWSLPSHVSMLTGHLPTAHGAEIDMYDNRFPTLAKIFQSLGYRTAGISGNTLVFSMAQGFGPGFVRFDDSFYSLVDGFTRTIVGRKIHKGIASALDWTYHPIKRSAADVTRRAVQWIDGRRDRPFFMVLNYFDVHDPEAHQTNATGDAYDDAVADVDTALGRLIDHLDAEGLTNETLVVVTSDHGESLGQHGFPGHGSSLYIEQVHVPLILRFPPRVPAGTRVTRAVSHISLASTILDLAGATSPTPVPGVSLTPLWRQDGPVPATWPMPRSELRYRPWQHTLQGQDLLRSLLDPPYHYVAHSMAGDELFNLKDDPAELQNLAGEHGMAGVLERFKHAVAEPGDHDAVESGSEQ